MNKYDDRIKLDIFKSETTYQNDYKRLPLTTERATTCPEKYFDEKPRKSKEGFLQDNETFVRWRPDVHIPFNLLWSPKEIVNTNPHEPFVKPVLPKKCEKDKQRVIKTRPRIYMSPAVSMDDIDDPAIRQLLCDNMYTSEWKRAIQESGVRATERYVPETAVKTTTDPIQLKIDLLPPLPENFRNKGKEWENKQLKVTVDPTRTFWEYKDPPVKCGACFDPLQGLVPEETKKEIRELISQDRLRLPHDAPIPGYAGYKPRFSGGIPLAKIDLPVVHPFMSVSQAITKRYAMDKAKYDVT